MADGIAAQPLRVSTAEALALHASGRPGKLETRISKPLVTARDLSLAYSPGVAEPCLRIGLGQGSTVGPLLLGLSRPAQIAPMDATVSRIVDLAGLAAYHAINAE